MSFSGAPAAAAAVVVALSLGGTAAAEQFSFKPRGRIQIDLQQRDWRVRDEDDTDVYARRLYLGAQGVIAGGWRYKVDLVLTPGIETVGVDDAFIEYRGDGWSLFFGEHNLTTPLEERTSSLDVPFIERSSAINAFGYGRRAGIGFLSGGENWSVALAAQGGSMNAAEGEGDVDESRALSARLTFAPILSEAHILHVGAHVRRRYQNDADQRIRVRPQNGRDTRWIDATSVAANRISEDDAFGAELVYARGPFSVQSEYAVLQGETPGGAERRFSAYYVDIAWSLTGESRPYSANEGAFEAIEPRAPLGEGGFGHWAISARYDFADLSDGPDVNRGEQSAYAMGLDWVPAEHWRFKLNYAHSDMDRSVGADDEADIISLRAQYYF